MKIPNRVSVVLSFILTGVLGVCIAAAAALVPFLMPLLVMLYNIGGNGVILLYVCLYALAVDAAAAIVFLFRLLMNIWRGDCFTASSVACLRAVSWTCVIAAVLFGATAIPVKWFAAGALGALFMGVLLRVVKNVIAAAVEIKAENDLTV